MSSCPLSYDCFNKHLAPLALQVLFQREENIDNFMTSDVKFKNLHENIKEVIERCPFPLKPLKLARYPLPSNRALLSPTMHLEHSHGCCYFGPIIKLNAALMAVLELMSSAELAAPRPAFCPAIRKIRQWKMSQGLWRV